MQTRVGSMQYLGECTHPRQRRVRASAKLGGGDMVASRMHIISSSHVLSAARVTGSSSFSYLFQSPAKMSNDEEREPIQLGKRTLDAIIDGVVAKLRESPPEKQCNKGAGSSSGGKGE